MKKCLLVGTLAVGLLAFRLTYVDWVPASVSSTDRLESGDFGGGFTKGNQPEIPIESGEFGGSITNEDAQPQIPFVIKNLTGQDISLLKVTWGEQVLEFRDVANTDEVSSTACGFGTLILEIFGPNGLIRKHEYWDLNANKKVGKWKITLAKGVSVAGYRIPEASD